MSGMEAVLAALQTLYSDPNNAAKAQANSWLQSFQKEPEAWETANLILASPDAPVEPKLFAAQTFRTKIIYDLDQLPSEHRLPLRDTLINALKNATSGPKAIITQLCIALADLLLQAREWANGLQEMIDQLGSTQESVAALLEFLTVLPQEMANENRIRIENLEWRTESTGEQIVALLSMYFQAPGVSPKVQQQTLDCLASWLRAAEIMPASVQASPFFDFAFNSLSNYALFDDSVNLICDLIHETQEIGDNLPVIQAIVPRLVALRPRLTTAVQNEDTDSVRGFCRLFVEAGETYAQLMLQHPVEFIPIVEAILDCSAYGDLDVVSISLNFWWRLAVGLRKGGFLEDEACRPFLEIVSRLVEAVIKHLRYPENVDNFTGQDRDDFRQFRHEVGDTLKDCCSVLGATACLARSYSIIETEVGKGSSAEWQAIEAALFSIRTMGASVDPQENEVMPRMFAAIPQLPQTESKVRYSATLVVGRYTEWLAVHPDLIPGMLQYILAGFQIDHDEVAVASASALKHLCQDCDRHMVPYLQPLFDFTQQYGQKMHHDDLLDIYTGYAHIIRTMPPQEAIAAIQMFAAPLLGRAQALAARTDGTASKPELESVGNALEQLSLFLNINKHLADHLPAQCANTASEVWSIVSTLVQNFGSSIITERICSTLRRGLSFFGTLCVPLAPAVLDTVTLAFEETEVSGYVWVAGRVADLLQSPSLQPQDAQTLKSHLQQALDRMTNKLSGMLLKASATEVQDCIEDYLHLVRGLAEYSPDVFFASASLRNAILIIATGIGLLSPAISHDALDALRTVVGHDSLRPTSASANGSFSTGPSSAEAANYPAYANAIRAVISQPEIGGRITQTMLTRILTDFHEDCTPVAIVLFRLLAERFPAELAQWVPAAVAQIPPKDLRQADREKFLGTFGDAISAGNLTGVRSAFSTLDRAARRDRERMLATSSRR